MFRQRVGLAASCPISAASVALHWSDRDANGAEGLCGELLASRRHHGQSGHIRHYTAQTATPRNHSRIG